MRILLCIIMGIMLASNAWAQRGLVITDAYQSQILSSYLDVSEDVDGTRTLADMLQADAFQPVTMDIPLYSFSKSAYWFRFSLENPSSADKTLFLQVGCSWLDSLTLYRPLADGSWSREELGDTLPHSDRKIPSILPTFKIQLAARSQQIYLLRVQTSDAFIMPLFLRSEDAHYAHERLKEYMSGALFGLIGVMFFFNLIVFIFSKDTAYLTYSVNLLAWFFLFFTLDGYAFAWLWPQSDWWTNRSYVLAIFMSMIWGTLFAKKFLKTREMIPGINRQINIWLASQYLLTLGTFLLPYAWMIIIACVCSVFFSLMIPLIALLVLRRGFYPARFYLCSWIFPTFTAFYYLSIVFGAIPANSTNIYILHVGIAMEVIMLSVALGDRMRKLTQEKKDLQHGLEVARVVQESFLLQDIRSSLIETDFIYRPADALGGDWFACIEREDQQRLFICLGDVTGHGIATSLITGSAAGSFQTAVLGLPAQLTLDQSVQTLAQQLNDTILRIGSRQNAMMTCTLLVIDLLSLDCRYLNAGHVNIFVKSPERVHAHLRRGSVLGFSSTPKFNPVPIRLSEGDIIILYSDGLTENNNRQDHLLNPKRLTHLIEVCPDLPTLKAGLLHYTDSKAWQSGQRDDSTVLMLKLGGKKSA